MDFTSPTEKDFKRARVSDNRYERSDDGSSENSDSLFQTLLRWIETNPSSFSLYGMRELTVCEMHKRVQEGVYVGAQPVALRDDCNKCWLRSGLDAAVEAANEMNAAKARWEELHSMHEARTETDLDYYEEHNKPRKHKPTEIAKFDRDEQLAWIAYTLAAWGESVKRRAMAARALHSMNGPAPPHRNPYLIAYIENLQRRSVTRSITGSQAANGRIYCFEHGTTGDFVMHRMPHSYKACGICQLPRTNNNSNKEDETKQKTSSISSSSSNESGGRNSSMSSSSSAAQPEVGEYRTEDGGMVAERVHRGVKQARDQQADAYYRRMATVPEVPVEKPERLTEDDIFGATEEQVRRFK
jgi:hypothetical protein